MTDNDPPPPYVLTVCDGAGCRPLLSVEAMPPDDLDALVAELARYLRRRRVVGRLLLRRRDSGAVVARRGIWP